jgi:hypothetical protein
MLANAEVQYVFIHEYFETTTLSVYGENCKYTSILETRETALRNSYRYLLEQRGAEDGI